MQKRKQLQGLPRLPLGLESIHIAFLEGRAAIAGQLEEAGYKWVHACLVEQAWQKVLEAEQQLAAEQAVWNTYCDNVSAAWATLQLHGVVACFSGCLTSECSIKLHGFELVQLCSINSGCLCQLDAHHDTSRS